MDEELATMSKPTRKPRQDLVVRVPDGPRLILTNAYTYQVDRGILRVHDRRGCQLAQFAKGKWLYVYAQQTLAHEQ